MKTKGLLTALVLGIGLSGCALQKPIPQNRNIELNTIKSSTQISDKVLQLSKRLSQTEKEGIVQRIKNNKYSASLVSLPEEQELVIYCTNNRGVSGTVEFFDINTQTMKLQGVNINKDNYGDYQSLDSMTEREKVKTIELYNKALNSFF
jgi:hypothetical protein